MIDFYIKQGDLLPVLRAQLTDLNGTSVNISGAAIDFNYKLKSPTGVFVQRAAVIEDAANGIVQYPWVSGDTSSLGLYIGEFVVTFSDSKQTSFPQGNQIVFEVVEDI